MIVYAFKFVLNAVERKKKNVFSLTLSTPFDIFTGFVRAFKVAFVFSIYSNDECDLPEANGQLYLHMVFQTESVA